VGTGFGFLGDEKPGPLAAEATMLGVGSPMRTSTGWGAGGGRGTPPYPPSPHDTENVGKGVKALATNPLLTD